MSMLHSFGRLLADLWNKIKRDSSQPTHSISEGDIVILVVGPTGSGKSWFIKEATKSELVKSSRGIHPFTAKVQTIRCELTDEAKAAAELKQEGIKSIVFVDTPSFLTECDDIDAQGEIRTWIERNIKRKPRYLGLIYMHRIETDPALEPIQEHTKPFTAIPGLDDHFPLRLHVLISYDMTSGTISDSRIRDHGNELRRQMRKLSDTRWRSSIHPERFHGEPEVAWGAVEELLGTADPVAP